MIEAIPGDNVAQEIHAVLEPMITAFPPLMTRPRHQRIDVNRVVLDFYTHRQFRAAWTNPDDVAQLLKSLNDTQIDGLEPADFRIDDLAMAQASMQNTAPTPAQQAAFDLAATRTYITALLQLRRGKVDPSRLDMHWNFDLAGVDPRADVNTFFTALDSHDVALAFAQAPPQEAGDPHRRPGVHRTNPARGNHF